MGAPPLGSRNLSLACSRMLPGGDCGAPAAWHVFWYDQSVRAVEWENSLTCEEHMAETRQRGWTVGFRHRVLVACGMPGALLHVAQEGDDEDGNPVTFCWHPFDQEHAAAQAAESLSVEGTR